MDIFWGALITAIMGGLIGRLIACLTAAVIKTYRKRRNSKVIAASMKAVARQALSDPKTAHIRMSNLDCDSMVMEYDPYRDEVVQFDKCAKTDPQIQRHIDYGKGMVVYD